VASGPQQPEGGIPIAFDNISAFRHCTYNDPFTSRLIRQTFATGDGPYGAGFQTVRWHDADLDWA
jgi:hypothetical protein